MKVKLFGLNISVKRLQGAKADEHDRLLELGEQTIGQTSGLREKSRQARFSSVGQLVDQGWTGEQISRLVTSWPDASALTMSMIVSLAGRITSDGVDDPDEVIAWTQALLEPDSDGLVVPRLVVRAELKKTGRSLPGAVGLWTEAAGSRPAGLAALNAGLTLVDARPDRRGQIDHRTHMPHAGGVNESDESLIDDATLWRTSNPHFGVVRVVVADGEFCVVLDDLNSDYREVELRAYTREGRGWREIFDQDDAGFPDIGDTHGGGWCARVSDDGGYGWTFGRERPGSVVHLEFKGQALDVEVDPQGWWLCFRETADQQFDAPSKVSVTI